MALIVETGSIVAGAESYISTADATAYHSARGNAAWAALATLQQEIALRRATDYMGGAYGARWSGMRVSPLQALDWPRYDAYMPDGCTAYPSTTVPELVRRACAELALRFAVSGDLAPDIKPQAVSVKVGPIEKVYSQTASQKVRYRAVDDLLAPVLGRAGGMVLVRA